MVTGVISRHDPSKCDMHNRQRALHSVCSRKSIIDFDLWSCLRHLQLSSRGRC